MSDSKKINPGRRNFLRNATVAGSAAPFALNLAALGASANAIAAPGDYKALVCVFLYGGNDQANTVLATDTDSWNSYLSIRDTGGSASIALPAVGASGGVLPIVPNTVQAGRSFAMHPELGPLKALFDAGRAAVVSNVGPLVVPTTRAQYRAASVPLPPKLFSHNDQQSLWQAYAPEGASYGWMGRIGDIIAASNTSLYFTSVSASGNAVMMSGQNVKQYQVSSAGAVAIAGLGSIFGMTAGNNPLRTIITSNYNHLLEKEHATVVKRSIDAQTSLSAGMLSAGAGGVPDPTPYTVPNSGGQTATNSLAVQLQTVARMIGGRSSLGVNRQVFFVSLSGFDTHDSQNANHPDLLAKLAHALSYFDGVMANLNGDDMRSNVTTFTASDFGRTLTSNGDGTDHGWGGHHFVIGGAVKGKDIYGTFPPIAIGHDQDAGSGSLIPTISVDQYAATLAKWMGLSNGNITDIFPNIGNFASRDIGFML